MSPTGAAADHWVDASPGERHIVNADELADQDSPALAPSTAWEPIEPWPYGAWHYAQAVHAGASVLLFGAADERGGRTWVGGLDATRAAGAYDLRSDFWRPVADPPFMLLWASMVAVGGDVYCLTQRQTDARLAPELWTYSVLGNAWRPCELPDAADLRCVVAAAGTLALWGSAGPFGGDNPIRLFDPAIDQWWLTPAAPWEDHALQQLLGLSDGTLVRFDLPLQLTADFPAPHPAQSRWRIAVLEPDATQWRELPSPPVRGDPMLRDGWSALGRTIVRAERPEPGVLDIDTGEWHPLPAVPGGLDHGSPFRGSDTLNELAGAGDSVALANRWAFDPGRGVWIEVPPIPGSPHGLVSTASVWAGERLLLFGNARIERHGDGDDVETRYVPSQEAWSWRPVARDS
jgi:hypothetical protein